MNAQTRLKPRDRIVAAAAKLFYDFGINPVGVEQIRETANVSKRTLYKYFATKEDLAVAAMEQLGDAWFDAVTNSSSDDPREKIVHVFRMFEPMAKKDDFFGCIMMNTSIELRSTDAHAIDVVRQFKIKLYDYFKEQAILMGVAEPAVLAEQLVLLHDGCSAWIVMRRSFPTSVFRSLEMLLG